MDGELTPEQIFAAENAEDAESMVPRSLMEGRSPQDIIADLLRLDWSPAAARALVDRVADDLRRYKESPKSRKRLVKAAQFQVVAGLLIALLALGLTAFTIFGVVSGKQSEILIAFGPFFAGLFLAYRGWVRWRLYRKDALPIGASGGSTGRQAGRNTAE